MLHHASRVESQGFAQSLLKTLALRERERVQTQFLRELARTPIFHHLILRGACAIHRVFLHKRYTDDIDFLATPEVSQTFVQTAREQGIEVEQSGEYPGVATYTLRGNFYERIVIGIDVSGKTRWFFGFEMATILCSSGAEISVRVQPLQHLLAEKLVCLSERRRAVDFLDLWLGLVADENDVLKAKIREVLAQRPEVFFRRAIAMEKLNSLEDEWNESLEGLMLPIPQFERVRHDLREILPFFAETP